MPYSADHKHQTRARIVKSARELFNRRGFEEVSIDDVMGRAGLTRGGFYNHFRSKDELYVEAVRSFIDDNPLRAALAVHGGPAEPVAIARHLVDIYLSDAVLNDPDQHCPLFALPSDVLRAGTGTRHAYTDVLRSMAQVFRAAFASGDREADQKAHALVSLCVGGMVLARSADDSALRRSLREAARRQALAILGA